MNKENLKTISEYEIFRRNVEKIKPSTIEMESYHLKKLSESLGDLLFKDATETQIIEHQKKYAPVTQNTILAILKSFYRWIFDIEKGDRLPDCIRRIKRTKIELDEPTYRERVVTQDEYDKLLNFASDNMHKAMIETLYNLGPRVSELLSMNAIDASYDGEFTRITIRESKTVTRLASHHGRLNHLMNWAETYHPFKGQKTMKKKKETNKKKKETVPVPMWINTFHGTNDRFTRRGTLNLISRLCKKAGIEKKINCHDFRHTSISRDRSDGVPISHIETKHGLVHGSLVMRIYDHNKSKDFEDWMKRKDDTPQEESYTTLKAKTDEITILKKKVSKLTSDEHFANQAKEDIEALYEKKFSELEKLYADKYNQILDEIKRNK